LSPAGGVAPCLASVSDSPEGLAGLLTADPQALLVAELDGVLAGSLIAAWDGWRGSFYRLAVSPEHRRKGLATMLLREGERRLRERGAVRLASVIPNVSASCATRVPERASSTTCLRTSTGYLLGIETSS